jgi:hypothetical protein
VGEWRAEAATELTQALAQHTGAVDAVVQDAVAALDGRLAERVEHLRRFLERYDGSLETLDALHTAVDTLRTTVSARDERTTQEVVRTRRWLVGVGVLAAASLLCSGTALVIALLGATVRNDGGPNGDGHGVRPSPGRPPIAANRSER